MRARIAANARTFLVKIKPHRGEPLNEKADDLADEGKTLAKAGGLPMDRQNDTVSIFVL